jgi:hypothetical protein
MNSDTATPTAPTQEELELRTILRTIDIMMPHIHGYSTPEYKALYESLRAFTRKRCVHTIEEDMIDIDLDRSQIIRYCTRCMHTL